MMMRWFLFAVLLLVGCGERTSEARHKDVVSLSELPPAVMKAAEAEHPGVKFDTAWKTADGNYEVRGKAKTGKIHDVKVSEDGKVLEVD